MVGPFLQGMLLMGVIYWYSKGMINMINEYYRSEFQKQLETNPADKKPDGVDDIELLLIKQTKEIQDSFLESQSSRNEFLSLIQESDTCSNEAELQRFLALTSLVCFRYNYNSLGRVSKNEFLAEF